LIVPPVVTGIFPLHKLTDSQPDNLLRNKAALHTLTAFITMDQQTIKAWSDAGLVYGLAIVVSFVVAGIITIIRRCLHNPDQN